MNKGKTILGVSISLILSIAITFLTNKNDIFKNPNKPVDIHGVNPKNVEETIVKKSFPKFF